MWATDRFRLVFSGAITKERAIAAGWPCSICFLRFNVAHQSAPIQHQNRGNPSASLRLQDVTSHTGIEPLPVAQAVSSLERCLLFFRTNSIYRAFTGGHSRAQSISLPCDQDRCLAHSLSPTPKRHATVPLYNIFSTSAVRIEAEYTIVPITNPIHFISLGSPPGTVVVG